MRAIIILFIFWGSEAFAQQKVVQYTREFEFREGIYLSIWNFKNNSPVPRSRIIFNSNKDDKDFFRYVLDKTTFSYIDSLGKEQQMKTNSAWGYCSNGTVYINHGTDFNRVNVVGSLCLFVAVVPVKVGMNDPFYRDQSFGTPQQQYTYVSNQYMIDLETGKVLEFDVEHMEYILQRDEALYKEFEALKKKQKRDGIFVYLRKYNEKHPVYFSE